MSNVQLYSQVAEEVGPALRSIVPEPSDADNSFDADEFAVSEETSSAPTSMPFRLRVTGNRPHEFTGRHIAMATGWNNAVARWYEINLYQTDTSEVVCDIRLFNKDPEANDLYRVKQLPDWASAVSWLETYNAAHDLICDIGVDSDELSAAEVSLRGITIKAQILELKTQYQTIVGNLLFELNLAIGL